MTGLEPGRPTDRRRQPGGTRTSASTSQKALLYRQARLPPLGAKCPGPFPAASRSPPPPSAAAGRGPHGQAARGCCCGRRRAPASVGVRVRGSRGWLDDVGQTAAGAAPAQGRSCPPTPAVKRSGASHEGPPCASTTRLTCAMSAASGSGRFKMLTCSCPAASTAAAREPPRAPAKGRLVPRMVRSSPAALPAGSRSGAACPAAAAWPASPAPPRAAPALGSGGRLGAWGGYMKAGCG